MRAQVASRDLLERLMIAFKYISAELDPYNAQVRAAPQRRRGQRVQASAILEEECARSYHHLYRDL